MFCQNKKTEKKEKKRKKGITAGISFRKNFQQQIHLLLSDDTERNPKPVTKIQSVSGW